MVGDERFELAEKIDRNFLTNLALDEGIEHARRLTFEPMQARTARLRSPVVITGALQYLNGSRHPLNLIF